MSSGSASEEPRYSSSEEEASPSRPEVQVWDGKTADKYYDALGVHDVAVLQAQLLASGPYHGDPGRSDFRAFASLADVTHAAIQIAAAACLWHPGHRGDPHRGTAQEDLIQALKLMVDDVGGRQENEAKTRICPTAARLMNAGSGAWGTKAATDGA